MKYNIEKYLSIIADMYSFDPQSFSAYGNIDLQLDELTEDELEHLSAASADVSHIFPFSKE